MDIERELAVGLEHDGQVLTRFVMRPAIVGDSIAAVSKAPTVDDEVDGAAVHNHLMLRFYKAAEQMQFIGAPDLVVTGEMLLTLADEDGDVIIAAQDDIAKKRKAALSGLNLTTTSLLPSDS
jgi:hypothetical protein